MPCERLVALNSPSLRQSLRQKGKPPKLPTDSSGSRNHLTALIDVHTLKENGATEVGETIRGRLKQEHHIEHRQVYP